MNNSIKVVLTGDRPTGRLHLGHFVGSLINRVELQHKCNQRIIIADLQALTDNAHNPDLIRTNIDQVMMDYLSVGLLPEKNIFFLQSSIRCLHEITSYYMNLVTVARLQRNPTVKQEILDKGFEESVPIGFLCHPISQAADITAFQADLVPVGEDQKPLIEQTNEVVRKFCASYNTDCIKEVEVLGGSTPRLLGIDGKSKASKSSNNAIFLSDCSKTVREKVFSMYTDPDHIRVSDPGKVEGNVVFHYLDAFYKDYNHLKQLKENYRKGGLGDIETKKLLYQVLEEILDPIREKRAIVKTDDVRSILVEGTTRANRIAEETANKIRDAIGIYSLDQGRF